MLGHSRYARSGSNREKQLVPGSFTYTPAEVLNRIKK